MQQVDVSLCQSHPTQKEGYGYQYHSVRVDGFLCSHPKNLQHIPLRDTATCGLNTDWVKISKKKSQLNKKIQNEKNLTFFIILTLRFTPS